MISRAKVRGTALPELAERSIRNFFRHDMATYAMALAFRGLLALFPFVLFLVALLGFLRVDDVLAWLAEQGPPGIRGRIPQPVSWLLEQVSGEKPGGLLSFSIIVALWSVSVGARVLMKALNLVFEVEERRSGWKRAVSSLTFAPGLALAGAVAVGLMLFTSRAMAWLAGWVGFDEAFVLLWTLLRYPTALLLLALVVATVYRFAPDANLSFRSLLPGAALAVLAWALASFAFSLFLPVFPDYGATYGGLGVAISLLLYLYVSAAVLLFGAEVNAAIRSRPRGSRDGGRATTPSSKKARR